VPSTRATTIVTAATSTLMWVARTKSELVRNSPYHRSETRFGGNARLAASFSEATATTRIGSIRKR